MTLNLKEKVAVITGGNSGIGFGIAEELIERGANVVITGRNKQRLDESIARLGSKCAGFPVDASNVEQMNELLKSVKMQHGRLDIFVANAGFSRSARLGSITEDQFDQVLATNFKGVVFGVQSAAALMGVGGAIVIIGSTGSMATPGPGMSVYAGTKGALQAALHGWVIDLAGSGIRINILSPGTVDTESLRDAFATAQSEEKAAEIVSAISERSPLRRIGTPREIGKAVAFLASDDASYINGVELFADGGLRSADSVGALA